jgi:hypothetical protein
VVEAWAKRLGEPAGFITSVISAIILLQLYGLMVKPRAG